MSEFERLRDTSPSEFERALLRSAERDVPSPRAFGRAATALGVATLLGSAAGTSAAAGGGAAGATFWTLALKPLLIGAGSGLVVATGAHYVTSPAEVGEIPRVASSPHAAPTGESVTAPRATTAPTMPALTASTAAEPVVPEAPAPPAVASAKRGGETRLLDPHLDLPAARPALAPSGQAQADFDAASIAGQIASVDRARQALRERRPREALVELDQYRRRWPGGVLSTEVQVLRIEAHLALGDRTSALRDARTFLQRKPGARYSERVRALFNPGEL